MKNQSFHQRVLQILKDHPAQVYGTGDLVNLHSQIYQENIPKNIVTTILTRLSRKKLVHRTPTQLARGYFYSLKNQELLDKIYQHHLLPYDFPNKDDLINQIIKKEFEPLRTDAVLNINLIQNHEFVQRYGLELFQKESTQQFLASLVGFCMCDGHIGSTLNQVRFAIRKKEDTTVLINNFKSVFPQEEFIVRFVPTASYCIGLIKGTFFSKPLYALGAPKGAKVHQSFSIPDWIYHGSNKIKKAFLSTVIGNEGSAPSHNKWRIQFVLSKTQEHLPSLLLLLNQIRAMLAHFGLTTSHIQVRKQRGRHFYGRFYIKGQENLRRFHRDFKFAYASEKQEVLDSLILKGKS